MAKIKRITPTAVEKIIGTINQPKTVLTINNEETSIDVEVKTRLSLTERSAMVNDIATMVFLQGEGNTEQYAPYIKKFAIDFNILNYFTNIEMGAGVEKVWAFTENTNIVNLVIERIGEEYIRGIIRDANEMIEYKKSILLKKTKLDDVLGAILGVIGQIKEKLNGMSAEDVLKFVKENAPEFGGMLEKMFKEIDGGALEGQKE